MGDQFFSVFQGEVHVSDDPSVILTTPLGSCVSACICDPVAMVGGMNHFLLVGAPGNQRGGNLDHYGVNAMPALIDELVRLGAKVERMRAWLFGGGSHYFGGRDIGHENADYAEDFLYDFGIEVAGSDLRGREVRSVSFRPTTGHAWLRSHRRRDFQRAPDAPVDVGQQAPWI